MFDSADPSATLDAAVLTRLVRQVGELAPSAEPGEGLRRLRALEELKAAAAAAQAVQLVAYDEARRAEEAAAGLPARQQGRGVAQDVALAERCSPFHGRRSLGWARILTRELPETLAALRRGETTEWRAMLVARETAWVSRESRAEIDATIAPQLGSLGDAEAVAEVKKLAYRLDPHGCVDRLRRAEADRRVTLRPAPDAMARLSALLPVSQGVAVLAALGQAASAARSAGDERSRGQVMADTLVERATGQETAAAVPTTINVVLTDESLVHAGPGRLVAMETTQRCFTDVQREFVRLRDQTCRTPYCDAPIRHVDHVVAAADGGPTHLGNAQGLCEACNYAKEFRRPPSRAPAA